MLVKYAGPVLKDKVGGYVRIERLEQRMNDGAMMARVVWAYPVVLEEKKAEVAESTETKKTSKRTTKKAVLESPKE